MPGLSARNATLGYAGRLPPAIRLRVAAAAFVVLAAAAPARAGEWRGSCDTVFRGTSTLHDFAGRVRCQAFRIETLDAAEGRTVVPGAAVAVLVAEMDTGNGSRDRQMREMFQGDRFPEIRGVFGRIEPDRIRRELRDGPGGKAPLEFSLRIRDVERPVHAVASNLQEAGGRISFDVEYPVSLKDYGLVPPRALFGLVRVDDRITVKTAVRLETGGAD